MHSALHANNISNLNLIYREVRKLFRKDKCGWSRTYPQMERVCFACCRCDELCGDACIEVLCHAILCAPSKSQTQQALGKASHKQGKQANQLHLYRRNTWSSPFLPCTQKWLEEYNTMAWLSLWLLFAEAWIHLKVRNLQKKPTSKANLY